MGIGGVGRGGDPHYRAEGGAFRDTALSPITRVTPMSRPNSSAGRRKSAPLTANRNYRNGD